MTPGVALGPGVAVGVASKLRCSASADAKGENPIGGGWGRGVWVGGGGGGTRDGWGRCESGRESYRRGVRVRGELNGVEGGGCGWVRVSLYIWRSIVGLGQQRRPRVAEARWTGQQTSHRGGGIGSRSA